MWVYVCEEDAIIIIVLVRENKKNLSHFLFRSLIFCLEIVYGFWMHEPMYTINKTPYMFQWYVYEERKREKELSLFLYRDWMWM
jgi:hypothetical protein